ncbi:MAG: diacylglycerol kinase family lipid kinase [Myxococcota bacterium]|nr:diacylglycerol kinase family lipid kinase [Myxococcota bacterium]
MKVTVIVNAGAGSVGSEQCEQRVREIREALTSVGIDSEVTLCEPAQLTATARRLASTEIDAVVAAGGDGTVSSIASGLVGTEMPLAVLPLGTLNHFARDIGMPSGDLAVAAQAIRDGVTQAIDVGEVNGHLFINNSSIGLYPEAVRVRDIERKVSGRRKWTAMLVAATRVLRRFPLLAVCVSTPENSLVTKTPFVFIGNNEYSTDMLTLGKRPALDRGHLSLYTVRCRGRLHLFYLLMRALFGKIAAVRDFETEQVTQISVMLRRRQLMVALDGEIKRLDSPLKYRVRPGALRVICAPAVGDVQAEPAAAAELAPPPAPEAEQRRAQGAR